MGLFFTVIGEISISQVHSLNCYETAGYNSPFLLLEGRAIMPWQKRSLLPSNSTKGSHSILSGNPCYTSNKGVDSMSQYEIKEKQAIIERHLNGESVASIVANSGIPRITVYAWIKQYKNENAQPKNKMSLRYIHELERKVVRLEGIIEIIHKAHCFENNPLNINLSAMESLYGQYNVHMLCEALKVSRGTFYNHMFRGKKNNTWYAKRREEFRTKIQQIYDDNNQIFGAAKIAAVMKNTSVSKWYGS